MNDKMLDAMVKITEKIINMEDQEINKIIEDHEDGLYAIILNELYYRGKMENINKLYRVTLKGMTFNRNGVSWGISYVIATDMDEAYQKVKSYLDKKNIGSLWETELDKIELIAEENDHTHIGSPLYL